MDPAAGEVSPAAFSYPPVAMSDELDGIEPLTEAEAAHTPLLEAAQSQIVVPKKGKVLNEDGQAKLVIMRPCMSRGRRIRGLPPIYEASMLAKSAGVFKNWPMFMDHVTPEMAATMARHGRSVKDLGGRVVESWYDPTFEADYDEEFGYKKGGIVGNVIPQDPVARMIERDPEVLHASINAWPTSAKPGVSDGQKGMVIEGIRARPVGSVDWVIRGGAGGRVQLAEGELAVVEARVVSFLQEHYASDQPMKTLKEMTPEELQEHVREHAPHLVPALKESTTPEVPKGHASASLTGISEEQARAIAASAVAEAEAKHEEQWQTRETALEERAQEIVAERESARLLQVDAFALIEASDLPPKMKADLRTRYTVLPSGPAAGLLFEGETDDEAIAEALRTRVEADVKHCTEIVQEAVGGATVRGQGRASRITTGDGADSGKKRPAWRDQLVEAGVITKPEEAITIMEGVGG